MKRFTSFILAFCLMLVMAMPAYATGDVLLIAPNPAADKKAAAQQLADEYDWTRLADRGITLNVFNWGEYMSLGQDGAMHVNKEFEARTGIKVNYQTFDNNEGMYTKLKSGGANYDVIIPSDYMIAKMINEDMLQPLDWSLIPNATLYMDEKYMDLDYDPGNIYSVPYTWGTVGIIYNTTLVDEAPTSWAALWDERYANDILMFGNSRDAFAIALLKNGLSLNPKTIEDVEIAREDLIAQKTVVQAYVNDEIFDKMCGGEAALAPYYAGDALTMMEENPDLGFVSPSEGTNLFTDAAVIPKDAQNVEAAHMYINFLNEVEVALANAEYIYYPTPHTGAYELLEDEMKENPVAYPSDDVLANTEVFTTLDPEISAAMDTAWSDIRSFNQASNDLFVPTVFLILVIATVAINVIRSRRQKRRIEY
ncbi:MAG: ABC transporter substrate-binding protein [Oscillospiraceae bacterium]|nr:ABC transporter substrate-binding protein [Oscillospiraceae bacterium]